MLFGRRLSLYQTAVAVLIALGTAATAQNSTSSIPTPQTTKIQPTAGWQVFRDEVDGVILRFPANWKRNSPEQARFTGEDGSVFISASNGYPPEVSCNGYAHHILQPLGPHPKMRRFSISGLAACSAFPSTNEKSYPGFHEAVIAVQYPAPIRIQGQFYWTLELFGDPGHILAIAKSLRFLRGKRNPMGPPDTDAFTPAGAIGSGEISLDFENDGIPEVAFSYLTKDETNKDFAVATVKVLKFTQRSGWRAVFEENIPGVKAGYSPYVDTVTSANGRQGAIVATSRLGSRVFTSWYVLASVENKISKLDPMPERMAALKARSCESMLSNFILPKGDLLIDEFDGSTEQNLPTRWRPPILELSFRFTGSSIHLLSVKQAPALAQVLKKLSDHSIAYLDHQYDFCFSLPEDWKGFSILRSVWSGEIRDRQGEVLSTKRGPIITIRHPKWTDSDPWQDIPIMVVTLKQWHSVNRGDLIITAVPISPRKIGRNGKYVFALPPRYTSEGAIEAKGIREVVDWIKTRPLRAPCR